MNDPFLKLRRRLYSLVNKDFDRMNEIDTILNESIEVYSQIISHSTQIEEDLSERGKLDKIVHYENKKVAYSMGETLLSRENIKIEICNPEDYRDEFGRLPDWSIFEKRRIAKLWVLK